MHESVLVYRRFLYLRASLALAGVSIAVYLWHEPAVPPNGGTWLGYTLGTVGAVLILWLLWFGVRKRQFHSTLGSVQGWLSAHIYLGTALLVVATLHSGFQLGWNVHGLAYVLMVLVILSGFFGVFVYIRLPALVTQNRSGLTRDAMRAEIADLDRQCLALADQLGKEVHGIILRSVQKTRYSRSLSERLLGRLAKVPLAAWVIAKTRLRNRAAPVYMAKDLDEFVTEFRTRLDNREATQAVAAPVPAPAGGEYTVFFMADRLAGMLSSARSKQGYQLLDIIAAKKALVKKVQQDVHYHTLLDGWLTIHIPLAVALLAALVVHVVSVFYYR
ncbi:MAG: hypothetical protein ACREWG_13925 [Gammaproteobacteria bacterium]